MTIHQTTIRPAITAAEQRFIDLYASVADRLPGARSDEVRAWREAALDRFIALGMPHRRIEEWKYTDLRTLMREVHPLAGLLPTVAADASVEAAIGKQLAHLDAYRFVFMDCVFRPDLSTARGIAGISFTSLRESLEHESAKEYVQPPVLEGGVIASLAAAFATGGAILSIRENTRLEKPIHLIFVTGEARAPKLVATQNEIHIGDGAEIQLIETHAAAGDSQSFSFTRLVAGKGARLRHVRLNAGGTDLASTAVLLNEGTQYDPLQMTVDGGLTRAEMRIRFTGPNARCHYAGAMMLRGHSHADFTLVVEHAAEACESRELVKAVVDGRSQGVFQGKVVVERGAQKTDGKQMANALLLSDEAEFDSKPELEIFADDVVCGHGSTAGQLDEDMLFYLRARGISEIQARALLIAAFLGEAFGKIENEALRDALVEKADVWLAAGSGKLGERS
jgi:Fe-S cluster assembly protein SufD